MPAALPTPEVAEATAALAAQHPQLAGQIRAAGPCTLGTRTGRSHFEALARSIVYQQLAGRAAAAIWGRTRDLVAGPFTAEAVLGVDVEVLRGAGLSGAKAASIRDLAERVHAGDVRLARVARLEDETIIEELCRVRGIGRWTAEMFLMFQLGRLDVWPAGDLGVRNGYARLFGGAPPTPKELAVLGDAFRPWRSVAAWYCWRAVDTVVPDAVRVGGR